VHCALIIDKDISVCSYHAVVRLVLASSSPRRAALLVAAGFDIEVRSAPVDERRRPDEPIESFVRRVAEAKADAVWRDGARDVVLAADTVVVVDGDVLGKPQDDAEAAGMLERLSGRDHEVVTGVAVLAHGARQTAVEATRVTFAPLSTDEIAWYVATGEPHDKAGAYGVQGLASRFVTRIDGSYSNVVGLPVALTVRLLKDVGYPVLAGWRR
jgi:nucleoside triphosphate pyrophosphatase